MSIRNSIDLLAIIFPALIIILGLIKHFSGTGSTGTKKIANSLIMLLAFLLLLAGTIRYLFFSNDKSSNQSGPKPPPLTVSKHSDQFNQSAENIMLAYYKMTGGFVNDDTSVINQFGAALKAALDSFKIEELQKDTLIYETALEPLNNAKAEAASIAADPSMPDKRGSLNILSDQLFTLMRTARYDIKKIYWQECASAFGDGKPGNWISLSEESPNPYGQKNCSGVKTAINFVPADTTKK